ncbi:MAG: signal peptidase I [Oscillospiraceae bacterium]|nr:signal peptidase I [Oscillospiraceae bacterium]
MIEHDELLENFLDLDFSTDAAGTTNSSAQNIVPEPAGIPPVFDIFESFDIQLEPQAPPSAVSPSAPAAPIPAPPSIPQDNSFGGIDDFLNLDFDFTVPPSQEPGQLDLGLEPLEPTLVSFPQEESLEDEEIEYKKPNKLVELIMDIVTYGFAITILLGAVVFNFNNSQDKHIFGFRFYNILSPSMQPVYDPGDMVIVKIATLDEVEARDEENGIEGDVVTFVPGNNPNTFLTHRLIMKGDWETAGQTMRRFVTQGDNNNAPDPSISEEQLIGKVVFHIPKLGMAINLVRQNLIVMCICFAAVFVLIIVLRSMFTKPQPIEQKSGKIEEKSEKNKRKKS